MSERSRTIEITLRWRFFLQLLVGRKKEIDKKRFTYLSYLPVYTSARSKGHRSGVKFEIANLAVKVVLICVPERDISRFEHLLLIQMLGAIGELTMQAHI